eukprot:COSAG06_NODE_18112_length_903_cov_1.615672_1_plen_130_part_00
MTAVSRAQVDDEPVVGSCSARPPIRPLLPAPQKKPVEGVSSVGRGEFVVAGKRLSARGRREQLSTTLALDRSIGRSAGSVFPERPREVRGPLPTDPGRLASTVGLSLPASRSGCALWPCSAEKQSSVSV